MTQQAALRIQPSFASRSIVYRTRGRGHGPITRLVSPDDVGQLIKPFVFLDEARLGAASTKEGGFGWHPHSGIATVTLMLEGAAAYADSTGAQGVLPAGAVEWFQAGGGAWHTGRPVAAGAAYQLWLALPPELETAPPVSRCLGPENFPRHGPVRVILGEWGGVKSPIPAASPLAYLDVVLKAGETWRYAPPGGHDVAWIAVHSGELATPDTIDAGVLAVFEDGETPIVFQARSDTRFILGSAARHPYDLVLGDYSVHTNEAALAAGEHNYRRLGAELKRSGVI